MARKTKAERKARPVNITPDADSSRTAALPKQEVSINEDTLVSMALHGNVSRALALWANLYRTLTVLRRPRGVKKLGRVATEVGTYPNDLDINGWLNSLQQNSSSLAFAFSLMDLIDPIVPDNYRAKTVDRAEKA